MSKPCTFKITNTLSNPKASACISLARTMCYPRVYIWINTCPNASIVKQWQSGNTCYTIKQCTGCSWECATWGPPGMPA